MTRTSRRIIFYCFVFIFFIATPAVLLYASGYSLNLEKWQITKTGSFYFDSLPKQAGISIDGQPQKTTPAYIGRLDPGQYLVQVSKTGFRPWEKNLEIK